MALTVYVHLLLLTRAPSCHIPNVLVVLKSSLLHQGSRHMFLLLAGTLFILLFHVMGVYI